MEEERDRGEDEKDGKPEITNFNSCEISGAGNHLFDVYLSVCEVYLTSRLLPKEQRKKESLNTTH